MTDVNPFEPWRPRDQTPSPAPEEEEPAEQQWYTGPPRQPTWARETRDLTVGQKCLIVLTIALLVGGLIVLGMQGGNHVSRVAAAGAALWVGTFIALGVSSSWRWSIRLAWAVAGLIAAATCWYWVPTTGGVSLAEAHRRLHAIRTLPAGDVAGYQAGRREREELYTEFGLFRADAVAAERGWFRRTADAAVQSAERQQHNDPQAALDALRTLMDALAPSQHYGEIHASLYQARRRTFACRLDCLEEELNGLIEQKQYQKLHAQATQAEEQLRPEAAQVQAGVDLDGRLQSARQRGVRRQAGDARTALQALHTRREYDKVATEGRRFLADLLPLATAVDQENDVRDQINDVRRRAVRARLDQARRQVQALLKQDRFAAVGETGEKAYKELGGEAGDVGLAAEVVRFRDSCRVFADLARKANQDKK